MLRSRIRQIALLVLAGNVVIGGPTARADSETSGWETWRIDDHLFDRVSLTVNHRVRYEYLNHQFRAGTTGDTDVIALRTLVNLRVRLWEGVHIGGEFEDSRAEDSGDVLLNTTIVNSAEPLRAYLEVERKDFFGGTLFAQGGRITMDLGSRRLVARNRFRNTINGFTGIDVSWTGEGGSVLRGFWTLPQQRRPTSASRLRHNAVEFDEEDFDLQFWGIYASTEFAAVGRGEIFLLGLHERNEPNQLTRQRELYTPGLRLFRSPAAGQFDYMIEVALQAGKSRASTTAPRLDHFAHFEHAEVGYSFDAIWKPRVVAQFDYASGDDNPTDNENNRFDTLFGARRFDFGPTGIYGPFARANLVSPGIRLVLKPARTVASFLAFRGYWLAARRDAWTTAGVRDPSGRSGSYLGSQFEIRVQWDVLPGNLKFETGYAHVFDGRFMRAAPNSNDTGDLDYVYTQLVVGF